MGFDLTHVYGLTEVYGPATVCARHAAWDALDIGERARLNARQGVRYHLQRDARRCWTRNHAARALGRRNHGRDHVQGQHHA
jgi:hypothetical protein